MHIKIEAFRWGIDKEPEWWLVDRSVHQNVVKGKAIGAKHGDYIVKHYDGSITAVTPESGYLFFGIKLPEQHP